MIVAGTGHRPPKLGGYSRPVFDALTSLAVTWLKENRPEKVISGMALGWDQALAFATVSLQIPLIAAIPFEGQENRWWKDSKRLYQYLMERAEKVEILCPNFSAQSYQIRNEWMVDNSDLMLAMYDGETKGGTFNCLVYARSKNVPVENLWNEWRKVVL